MLCLATLAAGCTDEPVDPFAEPTDTATTVATTPPATPTPTPTPVAIDVTTTPDEITPEWVEAVVNTLLAEYGEMLAEVLAQDAPAPDAETAIAPYARDLAELFGEEYADRRAGELVAIAMGDHPSQERLLPAAEFAGVAFDVITVRYAQPACVIAIGRADSSGTVADGGPSEVLSAISLRRRPSDAATTVNVTEWQLIDEVANTKDGVPNPDEVLLESTLATFGENLINDCTEEPL